MGHVIHVALVCQFPCGSVVVYDTWHSIILAVFTPEGDVHWLFLNTPNYMC